MNRWVDFSLGVFWLAVIPLALAAYGGHVAADSVADDRKRRMIKLRFWGMGVVGLLFAIVYQYRTINTDELREGKTQQFQNSVNARLDQIVNLPASKEQQREATKLKQLIKAANPASPRLGTGPDAYKDLTDEQVGQWAIEEGDKIDELASAAMQLPELGSSPDAARWFFKNKFNDCCARDVEELRTEILRRLGPPGKDPDEISAWTMLFPQTKYPGAPDMIDPGMVSHYAPYLRRLGLRLKRRGVTRSAPTALKFSEQELPPIEPGHFRFVVSINAPKELTAGYIAVQFSGQPYQVGTDFKNSKLALGPEVPPDNPMVVELLKASTNYVLQIGKTPFTPGKPVHVEARAAAPIHASAVTFLEE
jgi:hypothetical protein